MREGFGVPVKAFDSVDGVRGRGRLFDKPFGYDLSITPPSPSQHAVTDPGAFPRR